MLRREQGKRVGQGEDDGGAAQEATRADRVLGEGEVCGGDDGVLEGMSQGARQGPAVLALHAHQHTGEHQTVAPPGRPLVGALGYRARPLLAAGHHRHRGRGHLLVSLPLLLPVRLGFPAPGLVLQLVPPHVECRCVVHADDPETAVQTASRGHAVMGALP